MRCRFSKMSAHGTQSHAWQLCGSMFSNGADAAATSARMKTVT